MNIAKSTKIDMEHIEIYTDLYKNPTKSNILIFTNINFKYNILYSTILTNLSDHLNVLISCSSILANYTSQVRVNIDLEKR